MRIELQSVEALRFQDGSPVRAASAIAAFGDGFLVSQDDATSACWWRAGVGMPVRVLPPVDGHDSFSETEGTKALKPDLEAALEVVLDGSPAVLMLGSGSTAARMRAVLVGLRDGVPWAVSRDLSPLYARVAALLGIDPEQVNLEGACVVEGVLRWFHRGRPAAGLPSSSVELDLGALVATVAGRAEPADLHPTGVRAFDLGEVGGVGLAVTDAVTLPDGRVLVSAAAEDSPNAYDDGPVRGSALAVLDGTRVHATAPLPSIGGRVAKVEGLAVLGWDGHGGRVLAVVDEDDPATASALLTLRVSL
ncbi:hypothetical protein [Nocardioides sp. cx-173]|uniref:DUF6910 family protein n=1 Tax=Nocardioides sp. cx-173 TaxID=2898796 RepID=UPI001E541F1D|nr:hypothetical protein [Nocardioides sp. cx-173]MCD4526219.1 hypothetical protein [Nocardioides sp. cx-173]UGB40570.1 hypothetical protein LQ940_14425 [Nocardioides sp. cx-173]